MGSHRLHGVAASMTDKANVHHAKGQQPRTTTAVVSARVEIVLAV